MTRTYAVVWRNSGPERHVGRLTVGEEAVQLEGATPGRNGATRTIPAASLASVELDRSAGGRFDGRPCVRIRLGDGTLLRVASLDGPGTVPEIARRLAALVTERR